MSQRTAEYLSSKTVPFQPKPNRSALLISGDEALAEQLAVVLEEKYHLERSEEVPHLWSDEIELVFVVFDGDARRTIEQIINLELLSKGRPVFVLLKERDTDFIISASHYGARGFILVSEELAKVLPIIHMQFRRATGKSGQQSVFFSLKGGVGQTTLAVNIADEIARITQTQVVLVDLRLPLGDVPLFYDFKDEDYYSLNDFIYNLNRFDEELIFASLMRAPSGLHILPLSQDPAEMERITAENVKTALSVLRKYFDHVLVDCSHDFSAISLSALDDADNLVMVFEPTLPALRATYQAQLVFRKLGYETERIRLLLNRFEDVDRVNKVIDQLDIPCVIQVDNDYHGFNEAMVAGKTYMAHNPDSPIARQISRIAHTLHYGPPDNNYPVEEEVVSGTVWARTWQRLFKWLRRIMGGTDHTTSVPMKHRNRSVEEAA